MIMNKFDFVCFRLNHAITNERNTESETRNIFLCFVSIISFQKKRKRIKNDSKIWLNDWLNG